jgi:ATP-dependent DNA helicase RecG
MPTSGTSPPLQPVAAETSLRSLAGIGTARAKALQSLGLETISDLLDYLPRRYQPESAERPIAELIPEQIQSARGEVIAVDMVYGRPPPRFEATLQDEQDNRLSLTWFNGGYLRKKIFPGLLLRVRARVQAFRGSPQMVNPKWEVIEPTTPLLEGDTIRPIYPASGTLSSDVIAKLVADNLESAVAPLREWFAPSLLAKYELPTRQQAYRRIHRPAALREAAAARRRLVWDELMLLQLALGISRRQRDAASSAPLLKHDTRIGQRIRKRIGFELTNAQERVVADVVTDLGSGKPMHRLIQGDVGSGKTAVAVYGMLMTVANKMQAALLAPTEVLAEQHYLTLTNLLRGSSVGVELFTHRTRDIAKRNARRGAGTEPLFAGAQAQIAVGTQALLSQGVLFENLGLVVVDEQHKLGVRQRAALRSKGAKNGIATPHYLVMTATPIPRTLALSHFADFDLSLIDELPPGRQPIQTRWLKRAQAAQAYEFVRKQIAAGRQAYVVLPQIDEGAEDENDPTAVRSVRKQFDQLKTGTLSGLRLAMLHGQLSPDEKYAVMSDFRDGKIDVLITTTVIEVGIDVANATAIVIDSAERFGLSQLHQLRGRVGRGRHVSYCLLIADAPNEQAEQRLTAMTKTSDGFKIAEMDLDLRGVGEFFGTRQHGMPELQVADVRKETVLLKAARNEALALLGADPQLRQPQNRLLRDELILRFGKSLQLAQVG